MIATRDICPDGANRKFTVVELYKEDPSCPVKIRFDRDSLEYSPSEAITGRILLDGMVGGVDVTEIKINVLGTGRTSWAVLTENQKKQLDMAHASTEVYIDTNFVVDKGTPITKVEPYMTAEVTFSYTLPPSPLPSTFIDAFGSITYVMKVSARTTQDTELTCMGAFIVNGEYDLNSDPALGHKAELHDHKRVVSCCCIKRGVIEIMVKLPQRGFVLGEQVNFVAEIENKSTSRVKQVVARLLQKTLFHASGENKEDSKPLVTVNAGSVERKSKELWAGYLDLPRHLPPTTLGGSSLIVLNYALQFELIISGCTSNLRAEIPISIGTVGLAKGGSSEDASPAKFGKGGAPPELAK